MLYSMMPKPKPRNTIHRIQEVIDTPSHCARWPGCDVSYLPENRLSKLLERGAEMLVNHDYSTVLTVRERYIYIYIYY